jgi:hypothetical protein
MKTECHVKATKTERRAAKAAGNSSGDNQTRYNNNQ